jgi:hypothetical protein
MEHHLTLLDIASTTVRGAELSHLVRRSLEQAIAGVTKLTPGVLAIPGMSGRKYRSFINNLIEQLPAPRYLEVGSWAGSTLCSAIFGNEVDAVAVDDWSQYGGPSDQFFRNLAEFKGAARVSFLEKDFRQIDFATFGATFGRFGVYLFDGPHDLQDQYDGIMLAQPVVEPCYVQIVDDWNWSVVRDGTSKAIAELGLRIEFMAEIRTTLDESTAPPPVGGDSDWHNGYFISVLSRPS